jgi:hypothetical protein
MKLSSSSEGRFLEKDRREKGGVATLDIACLGEMKRVGEGLD